MSPLPSALPARTNCVKQLFSDKVGRCRTWSCQSFHRQRQVHACKAAKDGGARNAAADPVNSLQPNRRVMLAGLGFVVATLRVGSVVALELEAPVIRLEDTPNSALYDPTDPDLRDAAGRLQQALNVADVQEEEAMWTAIIDKYGNSKAVWAPDVVGRAVGNRGNARSRQGKLDLALADYNEAIRICPWSVDPVLNRGVVLEAMGRWEEALQDYRAVLAAAPDDPAAWNNLGNATAGLGRWSEAVQYYDKATRLAPTFSFAAANKALALYESGQQDQAMRDMRSLLRRYPDFPDMRAALVAALWAIGKEGEAESNWQRMDDSRYRNPSWLSQQRRWPPSLTSALTAFLQIKSI